jgi:hypothetical protein
LLLYFFHFSFNLFNYVFFFLFSWLCGLLIFSLCLFNKVLKKRRKKDNCNSRGFHISGVFVLLYTGLLYKFHYWCNNNIVMTVFFLRLPRKCVVKWLQKRFIFSLKKKLFFLYFHKKNDLYTFINFFFFRTSQFLFLALSNIFHFFKS